jgi:putative PIN family toxin of toxin-antitoxin system
MIGKRLSSLADVLCRHDVEIYVSEQLLNEIRGVIAREKFDKLISAETRYYFFEMVYDVCLFTDITVKAKSDIRDPKDLYLLSMAESVPVDYIISGDRDLTDMKQHAGIPILKYSELIEMLSRSP